MNTDFEQVVASYHRVRESGAFFDTFYHLFLNKSPEIRPMFARTDFPHQKLMLRESILELLVFAQTGSGREEIERLAARHRALEVSSRRYALWLDSLCEAFAQHDSKFNVVLVVLWREAMQKGIDVMTPKIQVSDSNQHSDLRD